MSRIGYYRVALEDDSLDIVKKFYLSMMKNDGKADKVESINEKINENSDCVKAFKAVIEDMITGKLKEIGCTKVEKSGFTMYVRYEHKYASEDAYDFFYIERTHIINTETVLKVTYFLKFISYDF